MLHYLQTKKLVLLFSWLNFQLLIYQKRFLPQFLLKRWWSDSERVFSWFQAVVGTKITYNIKHSCHKWSWQVKQNGYTYLWNVRSQRKTVLHVTSFCSLLPKEFPWISFHRFANIVSIGKENIEKDSIVYRWAISSQFQTVGTITVKWSNVSCFTLWVLILLS